MGRDALSSTKLMLLRECPRSYRERYVEGRKGRATTGKRRGSLVHLCLERAGKARLRDRPTEPPTVGPVSLDELLDYLDEYTARASYPAAVIEEARGVLEACAPLDMSHVRHVEDEWRLSARDGRTCTTKIDRADYHDTYFDREGRGMLGPTVLIHDYKSNGDVRPRAEHRDLPQTLFYLAAVKERYPDENVGIVFDYIRRGVSHHPIWWDADLDRQARATIEEALAELDRRYNGLDSWGEIAAEPWPATPGRHCMDCAYQAGCDGFADLLETKTTALPEPALMETEAVLVEYVVRRDAENANKERKSALGSELRARIGVGKELAGTTLKAKIVTPNEYLLDSYAAAQAITHVEMEGAEIVTEDDVKRRHEEITSVDISPKKLKAYLDRLPAKARAAAKKALDASKIAVDAGSHVRVEKFKNLFDVGEEAEGGE